MILSIVLDLKQIYRVGRKYPWPRPKRCRCGGNRFWGHGFVLMFFDNFPKGLEMRRYRCPLCGCVVRMRPDGYFARHHQSSNRIRDTLFHRIKTGRWPLGCETNCSRNWLRALKRNAMAMFGNPALSNLLDAFDRLTELGWVPVSRTI